MSRYAGAGAALVPGAAGLAGSAFGAAAGAGVGVAGDSGIVADAGVAAGWGFPAAGALACSVWLSDPREQAVIAAASTSIKTTVEHVFFIAI
jgi:hypothetical protein